MSVQFLINALIAGSLYCLMALGLSLIYVQARFINFSHGAVTTLAPYAALFLLSQLKLGFALSVIGGIVVAIAAGCLLESTIFRQLRHRNARPFILLITSLGIYVFIQNSVSLAFGDMAKSIRITGDSMVLGFLGARVTSIQGITICASLGGLLSLLWFQKSTRIGAAMRAVGNDNELARTIGIDVDRTLLWTLGIGSGLAGLAGVLSALDIDMTPKMGMNLLVMAMVAMILGGGRNLLGVAAGAYFLGIVQQLTAWAFSFQWQDAGVFVMLTAFLLIKPTGLAGGLLRKTTI